IDLGFAENGEKFDRHVQNYVNPSLNQDSGEVYSNGVGFESDEDLHGYVNSNIGKVRSIQSDLKTSMSVATKDNLPKGFNLVGDDIYQSGDRVGGITIGKGNSSRILIAPSAKGLYIGSVRVTTKIIVNELVHDYHISRGLREFAGPYQKTNRT